MSNTTRHAFKAGSLQRTFYKSVAPVQLSAAHGQLHGAVNLFDRVCSGGLACSGEDRVSISFCTALVPWVFRATSTSACFSEAFCRT